MLIFRLCCLFFGATICLVQPSLSNNQTSNMSRSEMIEKLKKILLQRVGITNVTKPKTGREKKVPQYMLDLYHNQVNDQEGIFTNSTNNRKWTSANNIQAFFDEGEHPPSPASDFPSNEWNLFFNVSSLSREEILAHAELRLSFSAVEDGTRKSSADRQQSRVNVYQLLVPPTAGKRPTRTELIDTRPTTGKGMDSFDVTRAVQHWLKKPSQNFGFQVHLIANGDHPVFQLNSGEHAAPDSKPLLVTFSNNKARRVHDHGEQRDSESSPGKNYDPNSSYCQRHPLTVEFDQYWEPGFFIAPKRYNAYYCSGECPFPLPSHVNSTMHAIIKTIVALHNSEVPRVCCSPMKFLPMSVLLKSDDGSVVLKHWSEMIVESCGCR